MSTTPRLLVVNPNTTAAITERYVRHARRVAPHATIVGVTGRSGAAIVTTNAENAIASEEVLALADQHWRDYDAIVLAISFDTGLEAARARVGIPIVGVTESALSAAGRFGPVGMITFGEASRPLYDEVVGRHRLRRSVTIFTVPTSDLAVYTAPDAHMHLARDAAARLVGLGAKALVLAGSAFVGQARGLGQEVGMPAFDAGDPAIVVALTLVP